MVHNLPRKFSGIAHIKMNSILLSKLSEAGNVQLLPNKPFLEEGILTVELGASFGRILITS